MTSLPLERSLQCYCSKFLPIYSSNLSPKEATYLSVSGFRACRSLSAGQGLMDPWQPKMGQPGAHTSPSDGMMMPGGALRASMALSGKVDISCFLTSKDLRKLTSLSIFKQKPGRLSQGVDHTPLNGLILIHNTDVQGNLSRLATARQSTATLSSRACPAIMLNACTFMMLVGILSPPLSEDFLTAAYFMVLPTQDIPGSQYVI